MGRFETAAATYAAHREPYPPEFFASAAARLALTGREALIDLGTGPGLLALGFAPYVARVVGLDPEPAMLAAAREAAQAAGVAAQWRLGRAEDAEEGPFDLVTIGRALHWMEREPTLAALDRLLAPQGRILICGAHGLESNPWREAFETVSRRWSGGNGEAYRRVRETFFAGSCFVEAGAVAVTHRQRVDVEGLVERALTRSSTSRGFLGERVDAFRAEMREALAPYFKQGEGEELVEARARIYRRV